MRAERGTDRDSSDVWRTRIWTEQGCGRAVEEGVGDPGEASVWQTGLGSDRSQEDNWGLPCVPASEDIETDGLAHGGAYLGFPE